MCGLFGVAQAEALDAAKIARARDARDLLAHRGPDGAGEWISDGVFLGHRRLSILDTSEAGAQPMTANGVAVTVNGEIYNYRALRADLEARGFVFRSDSDSEVVLHGYHAWGIDGLVARIEGMYAAVIHDVAARRIVGFRDRVGIKPLHYYVGKNQLAWSSELKALSHFFEGSLVVDPEAVVDFLVYRYIPAPKSIFRNVFKLPPGSVFEYDIGASHLTIRRYWSLQVDAMAVEAARCSAKVVELIDASVSEQLVSDVPLGLLLSGGLDSSAIAAFAGRWRPDIRSFSIGFENPLRDETPFALAMSEHAGTRHSVHYLGDDDMAEFPSLMRTWFDEPFADTSAVPSYRVCAFAAKEVTVALSGDGGDELFGGYRWYERFEWATRKSRLTPFKRPSGCVFPTRVPYHRELRLLSFSDPVWRYAHIRGSLSESRIDQWKRALGVSPDYDPTWAYRAHFRPDLSPRRAAQLMDFHTFLPDDVLTKVDRVSMAVSLECRPPLLGTGLVELAFSLPEAFVYQGGQLKGGLKQVLRRDLPASILSHGKQGFGVPQAAWMKRIIGEAGSWQEALVGPYVEGLKVPELQ